MMKEEEEEEQEAVEELKQLGGGVFSGVVITDDAEVDRLRITIILR